MSSPVLIEVALATLSDAQTAHAAGADRIELNAALELGGLTPSTGTIEVIRELIPLPIIAMVRPRPGGFVYSKTELLTMQRDIDRLLAAGVDGIALGILNPDRTIDVPATNALLKQIGPSYQTVFHRAFDLTPDPLAGLDCLIELGLTRVLTSGQQPTALAGAMTIKRLIHHAAGRIEILPGAGITPQNVAELVQKTGAAQIHGSFSAPQSDPAEPVCPGDYRATSRALIQAARRALCAKM